MIILLVYGAGTNTDCAILEISDDHPRGQNVVAWSKARTTPNVTDGIAAALNEVLQSSKLDPSSVSFISIGTTVRDAEIFTYLQRFDVLHYSSISSTLSSKQILESSPK